MPDNRDRMNLRQGMPFAGGFSDYAGKLLSSETLLAEPDEDRHWLRLRAIGLLSRYRWEKKFRAVILDN